MPELPRSKPSYASSRARGVEGREITHVQIEWAPMVAPHFAHPLQKAHRADYPARRAAESGLRSPSATAHFSLCICAWRAVFRSTQPA